MPSLRARLVAAVSVALTTLVSVAAAAGCEFPSTRAQCWSPDKRFVIEWVEADRNRVHQLFWRDAGSGSRGLLYRFERHVGVFWSSSGHHLAVTDAAGSDNSHTLLWGRIGEQPRSFEEDLRRYVPADDQIWRNHHQYFDVVRWAGPTQVLVRAWGYGDPHEPFLDRLYSWDLQGTVRRVQRDRRAR